MKRPKIEKNNRILAQQRRAGKEITKGIESEVDKLHELNAWKRFIEFGFFIALYFLGAFTMFLFTNIFIQIIAILIMGIALNSFGIFIHEGLHGLLAKNEKINHFLTFLVGIPILISATAYQTTHNDHHYELGRKLDYGTYRQHLNNPILIWIAYLAQLFLGSLLYVLFIPYFAFRSANFMSKMFIVMEYIAILSLLLVFLNLVPLNVILYYWLYPLLILAVLSQIRGVASHALGDVENIYLSSRTVFCSKFMQFIFLNENYHLEHHLFPRVPSYNLEKMNKLIWHRLPQAIQSKSYIDFLIMFFKAMFSKNLEPSQVVFPRKNKYGQSKIGEGN